MTREDSTGETRAPRPAGPATTPAPTADLPEDRPHPRTPHVHMTVIERKDPDDGTALDGRVLDTAEIRVLDASGLVAPAAVIPVPEPAHLRQLVRLPDSFAPLRPATTASDGPFRSTDMAARADAAPAEAAPAPPPAAYEAYAAGRPCAPAAYARFPRTDPELREYPARSLPGWSAVLGIVASLGAVAWAVAVTGPIDDRLPERVRGNPVLDTAHPVAIGVGVLGALLALVLVLGMFVVEAGTARVLSRFGRYRGTVRRTGLVWAPPLCRRDRVDAGIRHWRSRPMELTDRQGTPLQVMVLVVWQVRDTARACFAVRDCEQYLRRQIEAVAGGVVATLPCDSFTPGTASLRDTEYVNGEMTRKLSGALAAAGIQVFSAQMLHADYAPQVADSMLRRRVASLDAATRTAVLDDVVETVAQAVDEFGRRALIRLDDDSRAGFVRELTVAMYATRTTPPSPPRP
ncbi:peptidase [Yinghuangia sp. ASG 101]|uniref:SPFH domain-containing protein n=1 Tax=Yinghuangia sp. ASG 101 TaxID=2896848 RepID=UPI001E3ABD74|nr:SPFH domain-containing protein [Yinghuangia sp. ASG 101]UGQ10341.1 peptidase [Yinghuangia sp. ASG 101]